MLWLWWLDEGWDFRDGLDFRIRAGGRVVDENTRFGGIGLCRLGCRFDF